MWLLNTASLALEPVENLDGCTYAVLSHTWQRGEVTFQEIADLEQARVKPGFSKIKRTCELAHERGINYAWVDTCCIDKSSSAELTEAINSMFRWYKNSAVCFVFLCDLPALDDSSTMNDYFPRCRWFGRGWTLQELIAPNNIEFYDQGWNSRGNKVSLQLWLSEITGIDREVLRNSNALSTVSVARRMSWAAMRATSRLEDRAYCLFGIFDVHLPLIYGEGLNSFTRLQEAIAQDNNDLSLFAWTSNRNDQEYRGVFARSPIDFKRCGSVQRIKDLAVQRTEFSMTNKGFHITAALSKSEGDFLLNLQCVDSSIQQAEGADGIIAIRIIRTAHGYVRHGSDRLVIVSRSDLQLWNPVHVDIPKNISFTESQLIKTRLAHRFVFEFDNKSSFSCTITKWPRHLWDPHTNSFLTDGYENFTGLLKIDITGSQDDPRLKQPQNNSRASSPIPSIYKSSQEENVSDTETIPKKRGGFTSRLGHLLSQVRHSSTYVVVFGLETPDQTRTSGDILEWKALKPWAAIYGKTNQMLFSQLDSEECRHGFPYGLNQIRELLRVGSSGRILPKTLSFNPIWHGGRRNSFTATENSPFVDESQIQLSLSAGIIENSPTGMFRLVLTVDTKD
ncbi:HET-domain-containing protein [Stipitochalara longipes BDJ]|nr:HET-domain-containing protein [Stipitochalara longipes BDJ]